MEPKLSPVSKMSRRKKIIFIIISILIVIVIIVTSYIFISKKKAVEQINMLNFIEKNEEINRQEVYQQLLKFPQNQPTDKELSLIYQQLAKAPQVTPSPEEIKNIMDQLNEAEKIKAESLRQEYLASKKK